MLNPYDLLGVSIHTSLTELKKQYYHLALLAHPDKGGSTDDMVCVHRAYVFVKRELENAAKNEMNMEELEAQFKAFCMNQEREVPEFQDIYSEAFDVQKFNMHFFTRNNENHVGYGASSRGGYEDFMDTWIRDNNTWKTSRNPCRDFENTVVTFTSPMETSDHPEVYDFASESAKIDDFGMIVNGLAMADYKGAFSDQDLSNSLITEQKSKSLDDLLLERSNMNSDYLGDYIWSFEGFIDVHNRQRVKDYCKLLEN
jgi:hypothetical protein